MGAEPVFSTMGQALAEGRRRGVESLTTEVLLAHITGQERAWLLAHPEAPLSADHASQFAGLLDRAAAGEPLPYLTGDQEFFGLGFRVTPDVLIPRPDTELLVEEVLQWLADRPERQPCRIVDVGTGSGIIAVSLAVHLPEALITAVDVSAEALAVARSNADRHGVSDRIHFVQSDLLESVQEAFDVIAANLPYVAQGELLSLEVARWEPSLALYGGQDGLALIHRLLIQAPAHLAEGGALFLEIGYDQAARFLALGRALFPDARIRIQQDLAELDRLAVVENLWQSG